MGIGPADAIKKLCDNTGVKITDVDLFDVSFNVSELFAFYTVLVLYSFK